jgi:hypothetical protein
MSTGGLSKARLGRMHEVMAGYPREDMVAILMTQRAAFPLFSGVYLDFWTSLYHAIDD